MRREARQATAPTGIASSLPVDEGSLLEADEGRSGPPPAARTFTLSRLGDSLPEYPPAPQCSAASPGVSRRSFLAGLVAAGVGAAAGFPILERVMAAEDLAGHGDRGPQWVMVFDLRLCDGCRDCIKGCQQEHHLDDDIEWIKVYGIEDDLGRRYFFPVLCQQCQNAPCTRVCPVRATYHTPDGIVVVDQDVCIGCRMCMAACPYDVRVFNWNDQEPVDPEFHDNRPEFTVPQQRGTVGKCALCVHHLRDGTYPACLEACSMGAVYVGDLTTDTATNKRETVVLSKFLVENDAFRFREELGTDTRVYYIAGHGQDLGY